MPSIYVTGDTHGSLDLSKLNAKRFPAGRTAARDDYLIVAGDFGLVWDDSKAERYWRHWLQAKNFTTLFVDGNHENFDRLESYPATVWNGGKVRRVAENIIQLMRGQVFELYGVKIFTFGGAASTDRAFRREGVSWWPREIPSDAEYEEGLANLAQHGWEVDFMITHTCSGRISREIRPEDPVTAINGYFDALETRVQYRHWYSGHFHLDCEVGPDNTLVFQKVIKIV